MEFAAVVSDVVQTPKAESLLEGDGVVDGDDLAGEAFIAFRSDVFSINSEDGGLANEGW
jgi:hypothetical protein